MLKRSMGQRRKFRAHLQKLVRALHTSIDKLAKKISHIKQELISKIAKELID